MPSTYEIDSRRRLITLVFTGPVRVADIAEARERIERDPRYEREFAMLVDFTHADFGPMEAPLLRDRARVPPIRGPMALVVHGTFAFGIARMYELAGESTRGSPLAIFTTPQEALEWLTGLDGG